LGGVAVVRGEPDDVVLAGQVVDPTGQVETDADATAGRVDTSRTVAWPQPPAGDRTGSVTVIALFEPRVAEVVVAVALPEPLDVVVEQGELVEADHAAGRL
jgi:hypothetical protein